MVQSRGAIADNAVLFFEQWGCIGHPFHPCHKSKPGLNEEEVLSYSPEFQPQLELLLGALKANTALISSIHNDFNYPNWVAAQFPEEMAHWSDALIARGEDPNAWLPLPIHPYQVKRVLPQKFAAEIEAGSLLISDDFPRLITTPTMSFRTLASIHNPIAAHIKLPVSIQLTSAQRNVSPKATIMGPRVSALLHDIIALENGFNNTLDILAEDVGLHYIDLNNDGDRGHYLSVLFRENPMTRCQSGLLPVPVGALFADSPISGRAFVTELVASAYGDHHIGAINYFNDYAKTILQASLSAYLIYGIAFEAHQQNSLVLFAQNGKAERLLLRDFGDIRIFSPTFEACGLPLNNYLSGPIVCDKPETVREKFLHTTMLCHLAELGILLAKSYQQPEDIYWRILQQTCEQLFDQLRYRCNPQRWEEERTAILHHKWPVKSLLRMRLYNVMDDICLTMPNPLSMFSAYKT